MRGPRIHCLPITIPVLIFLNLQHVLFEPSLLVLGSVDKFSKCALRRTALRRPAQRRRNDTKRIHGRADVADKADAAALWSMTYAHRSCGRFED